MKLQAATQETQMEKTLLYPQLQREQKPSEVLPLCIAAQDSGISAQECAICRDTWALFGREHR